LAAMGCSMAAAFNLPSWQRARDCPPVILFVNMSRRVEFAINLHTAKALGLDVPATLLARADEVIE
jgi:hypothetical protein